MRRMRKLMSMVLTITMVMTIIGGLSGITAFAFETGVVVETESGTLANGMTTYQSPTASGGTVISSASAKLDTPQNLASPDARYTFNITSAGSYKVYLRSNASNTSSDSYWFRWDNAATYTQRGATVSTSWRWEETTATTLAVGTHTLDICHREPNFYIDLIVVAPNLTTAQKDAIDNSILGGSSDAVTFNSTSGSVMLEAEQATLDPTLFGTTADATASGANVITALVDQTTVPSTFTAGVGFNITSDWSTKYDIWIRYSASSSQNSVYLSVDGSDYTAKTLDITGTNPSEYGWMNLQTTSDKLIIGTKCNFKLYPAKAGLRIDQIVVTGYPFLTPDEAIAAFDDIGFDYSLPTNTYPTPSITPPAEHPRLLFKSSDIDGIKANMVKAQNANALAAYNGYLAQNVDGNLPTLIVSGDNYDETTLAILESYALKYALDGDATYGNKAITGIKNFLKTSILDDTIQDITRQLGHCIFVSSEIYDWCYPLLTAEDKNYIIVASESIGKRMEIGYPPSGQGAVSGHGGELQLFRDLLSLGIATYEERPDIYNFVAGRLLSQFIEPRDYWYQSSTHHQGDSYGLFRYQSEMMFQWIMKRMSGEQVFSAAGEFVPYQWIYTRRPDGQAFRDGDDTQERSADVGEYWKKDLFSDFYSSNFYGNSYVKQQYVAEDPSFNSFTLTHGFLTPVSFLLFNNPDLAGQTHTATFPLTKYFGSPNGLMIARTGWTESGTVNLGSNIAMAQMKIGEQWAANHHHLDAGSFQLYYKGALASESGAYDSYNTNHDKNYNKETIAHNALLIKDPNETIYGGAVNSGGQRRPGSEQNTFSGWMGAGYDTGTVLDHEYDTSSAVPQYSYIKGDITRAYTTKVSEVVRSMMFMPLDDENHPAALIVMDKVTATNPTFVKTWLLHSQQEPTISGNTAIINRNTDGYNGRMDLTTLLPANATLTKVGGAGNEFNINGVNYPPASLGRTANEAGAWRIEAKPSTSSATDYFLNVMQVSDASANATPLTATLIETSLVAGVKLSNRVAVFGKNKNHTGGTIPFTVPGSEQSGLKITVSGLEVGDWVIYCNSTPVGTQAVSAEGGTLYFTGGAGDYSLVYYSDDTSLSTLSYTHSELGKQDVTIMPGVTTYNVELPYGISSEVPQISAETNDLAATKSITQASATPGSATVLVTVSSGDQATYTINFTISQTPYDPGVGSVTSLKYRGTDASGDFAAVTGVQATAPLNIYTNSAYPTQASKVAASTNPTVNLYKNNDLRIYSDRTPATGGGTGTSSSSAIGSQAEFAYLTTTSSLFLGSNVTKILTKNDEKNNATAVSNAYSFTIDKAATVYIAASAKTYTNITNYGWTLDTTGLVVRRSSVSTLQYTEGDNKYYAMPNGNSNSYSGIYKKHYVGGANVEVPSTGVSGGSGLIILIVWDN